MTPTRSRRAFADYYRTTVLSEETDPNKLHDLKADLDGYQVYPPPQIDELVELYLGGADRDQLDPILDACVADYNEQLDEDGQVDFKGKAKAFARTYGFLASILPYTNAGVGEALDLPELPDPETARAEGGRPVERHPRSDRHGQLPGREEGGDAGCSCPTRDAEIEPVPTSGGGHKPEPELDRLSNIVKTFNDQFGNIPGRMRTASTG